ncbi:uncharacterized protein LOC111734656, partial [Pteropus vampyrus]|uniref:Uncharacterized protein LOC111734656 n=1 Tax=Pteropus vampyrus TaxID=132908 RepID=A0A6P6C567_PTEVA
RGPTSPSRQLPRRPQHHEPLVGEAATLTVGHGWLWVPGGQRGGTVDARRTGRSRARAGRCAADFCPFQVAQRKGARALPALSPEVLSVFVPPFASKDDGQAAGANCPTLGKAKRRSFRKKREKPPGRGLADGSQGPGSEDVGIPNGVDLTSTVSTMAKRPGSRAGRPPAASCPSPCAWCPGSPTTTPSGTASPGERGHAALATAGPPPPVAARGAGSGLATDAPVKAVASGRGNAWEA